MVRKYSKTFTFFLPIFILLAGVIHAQTSSENEQKTGKSLQTLSNLHVKGNKIVNESDETVILRGVNIIDPKVMKDEGHFTEGFFVRIIREWKANIIRVPIYPKWWSPSYINDYLVTLSKWAQKYKVYLIFDYHDFGNPTDRIDVIKQRWLIISKRFNNCPFILYDIFNEPDLIRWGNWRILAEDIIDTIRSADKDSIIMVGGINNGYNLEAVLNDPINRPNIVYSTHPYPIKIGPWETHFGYLAKSYPVFAGEWGFSYEKVGNEPEVHYIDPNSSSSNYGKNLINYFDMKGINWTAWIMYPQWYPNLIKDWNFTPTPFGELVKEALNRK